MIYVIDTSSIMVLKNYYPKSFPSFWQRLDRLVANRELTSVREVRKELAQRMEADDLNAWCTRNNQMFSLPTEAELMKVAEIFAVPHFQQLIGHKQMLKGSPVADPFLIAKAWEIGGAVVTEERIKPNAAQIPNVCDHFKIPFLSLEGLISAEGWQF